MYTAKVYPVSIVSPDVTIEEEQIARETLNLWNAENGKEKGKVFLPLPSDCTAEQDIYVLPIDNYVDNAKASIYIETIEKRQGLKVAYLEEIAYQRGWISEESMRAITQPMLKINMANT